MRRGKKEWEELWWKQVFYNLLFYFTFIMCRWPTEESMHWKMWSSQSWRTPSLTSRYCKHCWLICNSGNAASKHLLPSRYCKRCWSICNSGHAASKRHADAPRALLTAWHDATSECVVCVACAACVATSMQHSKCVACVATSMQRPTVLYVLHVLQHQCNVRLCCMCCICCMCFNINATSECVACVACAVLHHQCNV